MLERIEMGKTLKHTLILKEVCPNQTVEIGKPTGSCWHSVGEINIFKFPPKKMYIGIVLLNDEFKFELAWVCILSDGTFESVIYHKLVDLEKTLLGYPSSSNPLASTFGFNSNSKSRGYTR